MKPRPRLTVLVPVMDLLGQGGAVAAAYLRAMQAQPDTGFIWPSRGTDLRAAHRGSVPPNGSPFAVDASHELRSIAAVFSVEPAEQRLAAVLAAAALAQQGRWIDVVDLPSSWPAAHLVRPIFGAMGVGVGRVVETDVGSAVDALRAAAPDPASAEELAAAMRLDALARSAVECEAHDVHEARAARNTDGESTSCASRITDSRLCETAVEALMVEWRPRRELVGVPEVSAVVAMCDGDDPRALAATLASLARQEVAALEVLVVDDGSAMPGAVRDVVAAAGTFARVVRQGPQGRAAAMRRGLREARSPFVAFFAAGTLAATDLLRESVNVLRMQEDFCAVAAWEGVGAEPPLGASPADAAADKTFRIWPLVPGDMRPEDIRRSNCGLMLRRSAGLAAGSFDATAGQDAALRLLLRLAARGDTATMLSGPRRTF